MQFFLAFIVALAVTAALIPLLARWAPLLGLNDAPGPRKVHSVPVPRVGGIAMAAGILAPTLAMLELTPALKGFLAGLMVLFVFGVWDDRSNLDYRVKFAGQIAAVLLAMGVGHVRIESLTLDARQDLPMLATQVFTFVFLIGVTNAVNLADGLDGLAGGMALLCLCAIALLAAATAPGITLLALIEAGAILGFLRFNTHPARVFMGDAGSQMLGYSMGVMAILATQGESVTYSTALPMLLIGLPILDTLAVMLQRIRAGRSPFTSDRNHLHHRLLSLGFRHGEAVMLLYLLQGLLFLTAYFLRFESDVIVVAAFAVFAAALLGLLGWAGRRNWQARPPSRTRVGVRMLGGLRQLANRERAPLLAAWLMAASLLIYTAVTIAASQRVTGDLIVLCVAMFVLLAVLVGWRLERPLGGFERMVAYVSATLLVYLDQTSHAALPWLDELSWVLLAVMGGGALIRFALARAERFEVNPLDLLVLFLALVVPNLPGPVRLPGELATGIAKAVILLYVVEMLLSLNVKRPVPQAFLALTLGAIALRGLFAL